MAKINKAQVREVLLAMFLFTLIIVIGLYSYHLFNKYTSCAVPSYYSREMAIEYCKIRNKSVGIISVFATLFIFIIGSLYKKFNEMQEKVKQNGQ